MTKGGRARAMRAEGHSFASIAIELGIGLQWAYKLAGDVLGEDNKASRNTVVRGADLQPTAKTVVRLHTHNGGCSTLSGPIPISMPRIVALHGVAA